MTVLTAPRIDTEPADRSVYLDLIGDTWVRCDVPGSRAGVWRHITTGPSNNGPRGFVSAPCDWNLVRLCTLTPASREHAVWAVAKVGGVAR